MTDRTLPPKSADAYRTISEVADELGLPQHVLRFWETRFAQVKPLKRAGGRRFYRPEDVALLRAVQALLYGEGYTIKGVQRLLAEFGARHVADALARSRGAAPAAAPSGEGDAGGADGGEGSARAMADEDLRERREPSVDMPRPDVARPSPAPARGGPTGVARASPRDPAPLHRGPERPAADPRWAERLADVLVDLAECGRLLASVRSTQN